ncbi:MAG: hypothetical protein LAO79_09490 [Acidobacteriia bacterium]|nr:hypothetical protein [Terriglobia bacterium]
MSHFSAEKWSDYVRGLSPPGERDRMKEHLDSGCTVCREAMSWLSEVARIAAGEAGLEPPPDVVARAHAIFAAPEPRDWIERLEQLAAELVYDSRRDLAPAGVRSVEAAGVRLRYQTGHYSVDLMLEPAEGFCDIVGQIANESGHDDDLAGAVVQIVAAGKTMGETETNQFGEFMIEQPEARHVILRIALKHYGKRIDLPLQYPNKPADPD